MNSEIRFREEDHTYWLKDKVLPSVTSILKSVGLIEEINISEWYMQLGTAIHKATELDDKRQLNEAVLMPEILPYLQAWRKFRKESGFIPELIEHVVYHKTYEYAGTLDRYGKFAGNGDGKAVLIDIKGGQHQPWHKLQLAGYRLCLPANKQNCVQMAVYLKQNGKYTTKIFGELRDEQVFLSAVAIVNWKGITKGKLL